MNTSLYQKLFARMDELGAIRKDLTFGCEIIISEADYWRGTFYDEYPNNFPVTITGKGKNIEWKEIIFFTGWVNGLIEQEKIKKILWHNPVFSDAFLAFTLSKNGNFVGFEMLVMFKWNYAKPFLKDQSDELWTSLLNLLS